MKMAYVIMMNDLPRAAALDEKKAETIRSEHETRWKKEHGDHWLPVPRFWVERVPLYGTIELVDKVLDLWHQSEKMDADTLMKELF